MASNQPFFLRIEQTVVKINHPKYRYEWTVRFSETSALENGTELQLSQRVSLVNIQLHPTFEKPQETMTEPPYKVRRKGFASFESGVTLVPKLKTLENFKLNYFVDLDAPNLVTVKEIVRTFDPLFLLLLLLLLLHLGDLREPRLSFYSHDSSLFSFL